MEYKTIIDGNQKTQQAIFPVGFTHYKKADMMSEVIQHVGDFRFVSDDKDRPTVVFYSFALPYEMRDIALIEQWVTKGVQAVQQRANELYPIMELCEHIVKKEIDKLKETFKRPIDEEDLRIAISDLRSEMLGLTDELFAKGTAGASPVTKGKKHKRTRK